MKILFLLLGFLWITANTFGQIPDNGEVGGGWEPDFEMEEEVDVLAGELPPETVDDSHGRFWGEVRYGHRIDSHPAQASASNLKEIRLQYENARELLGIDTRMRVDGTFDGVLDSARLDIRELAIKIPTPPWMTANIGRQIIKWGTGDLIFVNDLFPKDYVSLYIGRDVEYMKRPSDAMELNLYSRFGNLDIVYSPRFTPYTVPTGERLSYFSPIKKDIVGERDILPIEERDKIFRDDVLAVRYTNKLGNTELALYGSDGYWPMPNGFDTGEQTTFYPRLRSYGAGLRGTAFHGIWSTELAYYDSLQDPGGDDPNIPNSQIRGFIGYERELIKNLDLGVQYYTEHRQDQSAYERALSGANAEPREYRMWTSRLTHKLRKQMLTLSLFSFYSPTQDDYYLRINVSYKPSDDWTLYAGSNHFGGNRRNTDFAQYQQNSNIFMGIRRYW
uniref:Phosphate-selective porin O and P n=1 Tax=Candidatus Kentrum sp. FW TaxID=2126338 RepID=A0A450TB40_9GAMM|nr:MAG: hypothetical protein BECKFW1821B_GA0114236_10885 [Candidatus Kentron sp. FW]